MEPHDLNRVFEGISPSPEQERAMLNRLLQTERKGRPMKTNMKRLTVFAVAAVLMVATCAAAVVTGIDQRLIDYFGGGKQVEELLLPGAMAVDVTAEDNGATLHVTQVLRDRYSIAALADFTVPEGTELDVREPECSFAGFQSDDEGVLFLDSDGVAVNGKGAEGYAYFCDWKLLEDGTPEDNHLSLLFYLTIPEGLRESGDVTALRLPAIDMGYLDPVKEVRRYIGDWSMVLPLPQSYSGYARQFDQRVGELDGTAIRLKEVYLSPITLKVTLEREEEFSADLTAEERARQWTRWAFALDGEQSAGVSRVVLTMRDGREIPLEFLAGSANTVNTNQYDYPFRLTQATSEEELRGGKLTLRIGDRSEEIPLDGLAPVE